MAQPESNRPATTLTRCLAGLERMLAEVGVSLAEGIDVGPTTDERRDREAVGGCAELRYRHACATGLSRTTSQNRRRQTTVATPIASGCTCSSPSVAGIVQ